MNGQDQRGCRYFNDVLCQIMATNVQSLFLSPRMGGECLKAYLVHPRSSALVAALESSAVRFVRPEQVDGDHLRDRPDLQLPANTANRWRFYMALPAGTVAAVGR